ncbi:MAG: lipid-A-disaccharide synthase N-terminal domain-containing protein [Candidatus Hydrogenedentes bacterium]|nr:lipid-A-disaccharide synthase N-terminal domain-containing protein [Candidatus Hydrogenedentota bacterium]
MAGESGGAAHGIWTAFGAVGAAIFYGRFYVQWIASELKKRSVMPVAFWYMSSVGSVMLLAYAVYLQSPVGALGQSFNIVVYVRNLIHIWREKGRLSRRLNIAAHGLVAVVCAVALGLLVFTWYREYRITSEAAPAEAGRTWLWLAIGAAGQALFACRFLIQWIATERKRKSVVPPVFWHLSVAAAALQMGCFVQRAEWVFAIGMLATILIYVRNLWFIHRGRPEPAGQS